MYKVYYKDQDANYPEFKTRKEALDFYVGAVKAATGKDREEILSEEWTSPKGVKKTITVRKI